MPEPPTTPGLYVEETSRSGRFITAAETALAAFVGAAQGGPIDTPVAVDGWCAFEQSFGGLVAEASLAFAVSHFFANGGRRAVVVRSDGPPETALPALWKAPAGLEAGLGGVQLAASLNDFENGLLNPLGINALRNFPDVTYPVVWGARTLAGDDAAASEWKYLPVRRTALLIEASLEQGLAWTAFEPSGEPLWAVIRLSAGAFMDRLFRQGAFQGRTPHEAWLVKCDAETTTAADIEDGTTWLYVGFAALKPAEFIILRLGLKAMPDAG